MDTTWRNQHAQPRVQEMAVARVTIVAEDGSVIVDRGAGMSCDVLQSSAVAPLIAAGDTVLVWSPEGARGVILGRLGPTHADTPPDEAPAELVIEARQNLTLRCGDGSITIREDGRILIKGKDLVSHAQRMNRIKGGAVAIN